MFIRSPKSLSLKTNYILRDSGKILLISLILPLVTLLTGCPTLRDIHRKEINQTTANQDNTAGQLLVWYAVKNEDHAVIDHFIEAYQNIYPNIKIIKEYVPQGEILDRFINRVKAGLGPDVVFLWQPMLPSLITAKVIQVIPKGKFDTSIYAPETLARVTYHKQLYALPITLHTSVLCYDQTKVSDAPATINKLITLTNTGKNMGLHSDLYSLFWLLGLFGGNLQYLPNHQIRLNNPDAWVKWLEFIRDLEVNQNIVLNNHLENLSQAFIEGKLAFLVCPTTEIPYLEKKLGDRLQVALLPSKEEKMPSPLLFMRVAVLNRESTPAQRDLVLKFIKFITNQDQQLYISSNLQSFITTNQKVIIDPRLSPRASILLKQAKQSVAIPLSYQQKVNDFFEKIEPFHKQMQGGEISASQAVEGMQKVLESMNNSHN